MMDKDLVPPPPFDAGPAPAETARQGAASRRLLLVDLVICALLAGLVLAHAARRLDSAAPPFEDAAILMRYAEHLAEGHGIVWNVGEAPVDGATDFLFMVAVAAALKIGIPLAWAARGISLASHAATVALLYCLIVRRTGMRLPAVLSSAYLAAGPGLGYVAAHFGTPFFALFVLLSWGLALACIDGGGRGSRVLLALFTLLMGLTRPEGFLLAALMLGGVVVAAGWREARAAVVTAAGLLLVAGGAYFLWRWGYFGHPLPNPFVKKGGGLLYPAPLWSSVDTVLWMTIPFVVPLLLPVVRGDRRTMRLAWGAAIPLAGFTLAWVLLSDEMNYGMRFQYPVLPMLLLTWPALLAGHRPPAEGPGGRVMRPAAPGIAAAAAMILLVVAYGHLRFGDLLIPRRDGRYAAGVTLRRYAGKGYAMAVSEAGLLPLYSRWTAVDAWGLNDPAVARAGVVTAEHLDRYRPALIMIHANYAARSGAGIGGMLDAWMRMTAALRGYAEGRGYVLAVAYGAQPDDTHLYYLRADLPERDEIASALRRMDYRWYGSGERAVNFVAADVGGTPP